MHVEPATHCDMREFQTQMQDPVHSGSLVPEDVEVDESEDDDEELSDDEEELSDEDDELSDDDEELSDELLDEDDELLEEDEELLEEDEELLEDEDEESEEDDDKEGVGQQSEQIHITQYTPSLSSNRKTQVPVKIYWGITL